MGIIDKYTSGEEFDITGIPDSEESIPTIPSTQINLYLEGLIQRGRTLKQDRIAHEKTIDHILNAKFHEYIIIELK